MSLLMCLSRFNDTQGDNHETSESENKMNTARPTMQSEDYRFIDHAGLSPNAAANVLRYMIYLRPEGYALRLRKGKNTGPKRKSFALIAQRRHSADSVGLYSGSPQDDVNPTVSVHEVAELTNLEGKGSVLKGFLHLPPPKGTCG